MLRHLLHQTGKVLKLIIICSVILYIAVIILQNQFFDMKKQGFDLQSAVLISLGFAVSFRVMLCCRKKV